MKFDTIRIAALFAASLSLSLAGCGGGSAFSPTYPDNDSVAMAPVIQAIAQRRASAPAVATLAEDGTLAVYDLPMQQAKWTSATNNAVSAPILAGEFVVLHESSGVVVRSLQSGTVLATVPDNAMHLAGAAGEGTGLVLCLSTGGGVGAQSEVVFLENGSVSWTQNLEQSLGAPSIAGGQIFIPWATQNVSVLNTSGDEVARLRLLEEPVGHALSLEGGVYLAQRGVFRVTPGTSSGSREGGAFFAPAIEDLPGSPPLMTDTTRPAPTPQSAVHRVRVEWAPGGNGEEMRFAHDLIYAIYYRAVFALEASTLEPRWVYTSERDIVGAQSNGSSLVLIDAGGAAISLAADSGTVQSEGNASGAITVASVRAEGYRASGTGTTTPVLEQLTSIAQSPDSRLLPAQMLAIRMLAEHDSGDATRLLIETCDASRAPAELKRAACEALEGRTTGGSHIVQALSRRARFLEDTQAPPVGALARAAASMNETAAVESLLSHFVDPATPEEDLVAVMNALVTLEADTTAAFTHFFRTYHAGELSEAMLNAVTRSAQSLAATEEGRALVDASLEDPFTRPQTRGRIREMLEALDAEAAAATAEEADSTEGPSETDAETEE